MRSWLKTLRLAIIAALVGLVPTSGRASAVQVADTQCATAQYEADRTKLSTVDLDQGGASRRYYVFQGDNLVAANELRPLWQRSCERKKTRAAQKNGSPIELNISLDDQGHRVIWPRNRRTLSYAIDRGSFPDAAKYKAAVRAMAKATGDWAAVCSGCGIRFVYKSALDNGTARIASDIPGVGEVTFIVTDLLTDQEFIAASFFPNDLPYKRRLYVTPSFFTSEFDPAGVLRHEIGHILGYRHEHLGIAVCPSETGAWESVGGYTPDSVMHYLCGGAGSKTLLIVPRDKVQHRIAYSGN